MRSRRAGSDPASAAAPPSRRSALIRSGLIVGGPGRRLRDHPPAVHRLCRRGGGVPGTSRSKQILVMTALGIVAWVVSGLIFCALIEGLSVVRGTMSWLILAGIGASVPFGPWNMGVLWVVVRGWGVDNASGDGGCRPLRRRQRAESARPAPHRADRPRPGRRPLGCRARRRGVDHRDPQRRRVHPRDRPDHRGRPLGADRELDRTDRSAHRGLDPAPSRTQRVTGRGGRDPSIPRPARPRDPATRAPGPDRSRSSPSSPGRWCCSSGCGWSGSRTRS